MNEAENRAELIDPKLKESGWGVAEGSKILREYPITAVKTAVIKPRENRALLAEKQRLETPNSQRSAPRCQTIHTTLYQIRLTISVRTEIIKYRWCRILHQRFYSAVKISQGGSIR